MCVTCLLRREGLEEVGDEIEIQVNVRVGIGARGKAAHHAAALQLVPQLLLVLALLRARRIARPRLRL